MSSDQPIPKKTVKRRKRRTRAELEQDEYYVKPADFLREIENYYACGEISPTLGEYVLKIANGLARKSNFKGYSYINDMKSDAIFMMNNALLNRNFKLHLGKNPFSYFTTIANNAFINRIKVEKKAEAIEREARERCYDDIISANEYELHGVSIYQRPEDAAVRDETFWDEERTTPENQDGESK